MTIDDGAAADDGDGDYDDDYSDYSYVLSIYIFKPDAQMKSYQ